MHSAADPSRLGMRWERVSLARRVITNKCKINIHRFSRFRKTFSKLTPVFEKSFNWISEVYLSLLWWNCQQLSLDMWCVWKNVLQLPSHPLAQLLHWLTCPSKKWLQIQLLLFVSLEIWILKCGDIIVRIIVYFFIDLPVAVYRWGRHLVTESRTGSCRCCPCSW